MTSRERLTIGALGGAAPVVLNLLVVDLVTTLRDLTAIVAISYVVRLVALFAAGAITGWMHDDEIKPSKIFQLGMVAPAILTSIITGSALRADAVGHGATAWSPVETAHAAQMAQMVRPYADDIPSQIWRGLFGVRNEPVDLLIVVSEAPTEFQARAALQTLRSRYPLPFNLFFPAPQLGLQAWMVTLGGQMTFSDYQRAMADAERWRLPVSPRTVK